MPVFVILSERGEHIVNIEILLAHLDFPFVQFLTVNIPDVLIKGVETGRNCSITLNTPDVRRHCIAQFATLRFGDFIIFAFP
jgi:hypothetical protein